MIKKILKRSGTLVNFDINIVKRSLIKAGATKELADTVAREIEMKIQDGDSTGKIYKEAFEILNSKEKAVAMHYSLKRALFNLGPTGFPFEKFVAEIFSRLGYKTRTNVHLQGVCTSHEVDVLTTHPKRIGMEVKFHNDMRNRTDVKAVLYLKARFDDLMGKTRYPLFKKKGTVSRCILVTNTKFTRKAIEYAECAGVELLGWNYPTEKPLPTLIAEVDAHPITCIPSIKKSEVEELLEMGIVSCKGLSEKESVLKTLDNNKDITREIEMLCNPTSRRL